ncbi:MAG: hypothetical protein HQ517_15725 [SAR324 cluster bacterium]|nr:hypothetical protein [SAR324 cluster bacterium]
MDTQYPELDLIAIIEGEETIIELAEVAARELMALNTPPLPARHLFPPSTYISDSKYYGQHDN